MLTQRKLAIILSRLNENPNPKYKLEQYSITPSIASSILFLAKKDIKNKIVYDLGCGSGRFAIGAALLGAKKVFGVDIDKRVLEIARQNAKLVEEKTGVKITSKINWVCYRVENLYAKADTVIQFPPISGVRKNWDIIFLRKALQIVKNVYSVHKFSKATKEKIEKVCKEFKAKIKLEKKFKYKLPWKEKRKIGYELLLVVVKR